MGTRNKIDRKSFLVSTLAAYSTVALGGCSDEDAGDTHATGGTDTGGSASGGSATGGSATGGSATGGSGLGGSGGAEAGSSGTGGSGGTDGGGSAGSAGSDTGGMGGSGGTDGGTFLCTADTSNGMHSHPLTVPSSDVERGSQDAAYVLEDGGSGHTHTVALSEFDYTYLQSGMEVRVQSSITLDHRHLCVINCTRG
jgi:hypothetical protein